MKELINEQKSSQSLWLDESGREIPYKRITKFERLAERTTARLAKEAVSVHDKLVAFKKLMQKEAEAMYAAFEKENGQIGKGKGSATFYNFDRTIKVQVKMSERITFDENTIELAKNKLDELLEDGLTGAKDFVRPLVMDAFETSAGKLDTKRVLGLRRHASRIKDSRYDEAMRLIDQSIRTPISKEYFQIWLMDENGEYQDVQLNFASV
ncbi:DUF3164 family protein [Peijinzhouia sedimentorum]